ncbi:MAG TPA: SH3 domain-containing protein [Thermomicrobiales bacterium]|nr:SH3 domain-containing protein [Thermomicrobiales bacterium]
MKSVFGRKRRGQTRTGADWRSRLVALTLTGALALAGVVQPVLTPSVAFASNHTARITGDDGVLLRAKPSFGGEVLDALAEGTTVELRIDEADTVLDPDGATRWWPIRVHGQDGWVAGYFLDTAIAPAGESATRERPADPTMVPEDGPPPAAPERASVPQGATARVDDPEGVNLRAEPSTDSEVLAPLAAGTIVELRLDETDTVVKGNVRWWPVRVYGEDGWIAGEYLADDAEPGEAPPPATEREPVAEQPARDPVTFRTGQYVAADASDGLNIRAEGAPGAAPVGFVAGGEIVQVMDGPAGFENSINGWYLITTGDVTGYVDGDLLRAAEQPAPPAEVEAAPTPPRQAATFGAGDIVSPADGDGLNIRADASTDGEVVASLAPDAVIEIVGEAAYDGEGNVWYPVVADELTGYAAGAFLVAAAARPVPTEAPPPPAPVQGTATGTFMMPVDGYTFTQPYGCSPYAFEPWNGNLGCNFHNGIDLAAPSYTPIVASDGGIVKYAGWCDCGLGYYVEIDHGNGFGTVYGHMAEMPYVATGQAVNQGDVVGPMGSTGISTGPHVHFMLKLNGSTIDPLGYVG